MNAISLDNNPWWLEPTPRRRLVSYYRHLRSYFNLPALQAWGLAKASFGEVPKAREYRQDRFLSGAEHEYRTHRNVIV